MSSSNLPSNAVSSLPLPTPKVHVLGYNGQSSPNDNFRIYNGQPVDSFGQVSIILQDIPNELFKPEYELRVELMRWTPTRNKRGTHYPVPAKRGAGWIHTLSQNADGTPNGFSVAGRNTRHGKGSPIPSGNDRTTEISLVGNANGTKIIWKSVHIAQFFQGARANDNSGGNFDRVAYRGRISGRSNKRNVNNLSRWGYFAFRFTYWDGTQYISSPISDSFKYGAVESLYQFKDPVSDAWTLVAKDKTTAIEKMTFSSKTREFHETV
jgi:hypothetical protein